MRRVWLFDLGNSRFKFAPLVHGSLGQVNACAYPETQMIQAMEETLPSGDEVYVASVAPPEITQTFIRILKNRFAKLQRVSSVSRYGSIQVAYAEPQRLGVDRFLAMLAGYDAQQHVLIVGVGTALTIDLLTAEGNHLGGIISASPALMRTALHQRAVQLPVEGGNRVLFATNTEDALASGCEGSSLAMIKESVKNAQQRLQAPIRLLLHGGGGFALVSALSKAEYRPSLVLDGLAIWAESQNKP